MNVDLIFKIAAIGILVSVLHQVLVRAGREDQAMLTTCEDAYNNLIKYLPSAYKQYKILYSQNPDEFRDFYEYAKELMSSLNLQY